jgi:hypothetical protein
MRQDIRGNALRVEAFLALCIWALCKLAYVIAKGI